jgi:excisionase family DNA binding protein
MDDDLLTTAEAARVAGVGTTSVKRWADLKLLPCVKTPGGHRRYLRRDLERFLQEHGGSRMKEPELGWLDLLIRAEVFDLQGALLSARGRLGAWHRVAEEVGAAVAALGAAWARGDVTVLEEHVASERLARALARCGETLPLAPDAPVALLTTAEGDDHTLGLSLAELCLREAGWRCLWTGRCTPIAEIVAGIEVWGPRLLAVSASEYSSDAVALADEAARLGVACREAGVELVLGGGGAWPQAPKYGKRVRTLDELHEVAARAR